jgi:hypothetical protein
MIFNHTTEAIKRAECEISEGRWKAGDELCREAADRAGLRACAKEIKQRGYTITVKELRKWRDTAAAFPPAQRRPDISFDVHAAVGSPEMLRRVLPELEKLKWPMSATRAAWVAATLRDDYKTSSKIYRDIYQEDKRAAGAAFMRGSAMDFVGLRGART